MDRTRESADRFSQRHVSKVFESAREIAIDDNSKIVIMSDCHRGDGSASDNFDQNRLLYIAALERYDSGRYTYIELGDGDELWENQSLSDIVGFHAAVFLRLAEFYKAGRLFFLYGNHDIVKRDKRIVKTGYGRCFDVQKQRSVALFPDIEVHEGLILRHSSTGRGLFLLHGHQADFLNNELWKLSRFLVRHLWRPLEQIGFNDPTSASKNRRRKIKIEKKLAAWSKSRDQMLIAGHTHRPAFPRPGEPLYFNDGCCVTPRYITAIEIKGGKIALVGWRLKTRKDGVVYAGREVLGGPTDLKAYFNA